MGKSISATLVAANQMPEADVKRLKGAIYNLFPGIDTVKVDYAVAAYFMVNDPSPETNWEKSPRIDVDGVVISASAIAGGIVNTASGDGILRKFLSSAYEEIVPTVIKIVPKVALILAARASECGLTGVDPMVAVSWVRGITKETASSGPARSVMKHRATSKKSTVADKVLPSSEVVEPPQVSVAQSARTFF